MFWPFILNPVLKTLKSAGITTKYGQRLVLVFPLIPGETAIISAGFLSLSNDVLFSVPRLQNPAYVLDFYILYLEHVSLYVQFLLCLQSCPFWNNWTEWSPCTSTCGGGMRTHNRTCANGEPGDAGCRGDVLQTGRCNVQVRYLVDW